MKKKNNEYLTNELLTNKFQDNFELALHAISIAQNQVEAGKEFTLGSMLNTLTKEVAKEETPVVEETSELV